MKNPIISSAECTGQDGFIDNKPRIGMTFISEDEAFEYYKRYGEMVGFNIKKDYACKSKEDKAVTTERRFSCNNQGYWRKDKSDVHTKRPCVETKTNCLARMCISRLSNGHYECCDFFDDHNHLLQILATNHLKQSKRHISNLGALKLDLADDSSIKHTVTFEYMDIQVGGRENLGETKQTVENTLPTKRQSGLAYGEAGCLLAYFKNKERLYPSFRHSFLLDNEEKVTNTFWADPRMIIDYALFGDVVFFDTTFCTKKEYRPFSVFMGFNHHRGVTIFGVALLYDKTVESYKWLFETFLRVHGKKKPLTIFTDQDSAMATAIADVLHETWHGLCTCHIMQTGIKHLGDLMKYGSPFLIDFNKCMFHFEDVKEFENAWKNLRDNYQLQDNSWLDWMYEMKKKWAHCYMKCVFTLGVRSIEPSESINNELKDFLRLNVDLLQFFEHFEWVVEGRRSNELKAEFEARNMFHDHMCSKVPMVRQAGKVYTPYIFKQFLEEYDKIGTCSLKSLTGNGFFCECVVGIVDEERNFKEGEYKVLCKLSDQLVECNCRKFETYGILCCHALKILGLLNIKLIPEKYILRRWTWAASSTVGEDSKGKQAARITVGEDGKGKQVMEDVQMSREQRFRLLCPKLFKLLEQASDSKKGLEMVDDFVDTLSRKLAALTDGPHSEPSVNSIDGKRKSMLKKKEGSVQRQQTTP